MLAFTKNPATATFRSTCHLRNCSKGALIMKKTVFSLLLLCATSAFASPDPADFPETLHVTNSHLVFNPSGHDPVPHQQLNVIVGGKKYELYGTSISAISDAVAIPAGVLPVGDYKAKLIQENWKPAYLLFRSYQILLPDGKTITLRVIGQDE
jgi:hypothetical protein